MAENNAHSVDTEEDRSAQAQLMQQADRHMEMLGRGIARAVATGHAPYFGVFQDKKEAAG